MERETKDIQIGDHAFKVKTYATAREVHTIQQTLFKGAKVEVVGETPKISDFDAGIQFEMQLEMVRQMVVELDGSAENIVERCEALPHEDFDQLAAALDALISKKKS